jgi:phosphatidate cytidylyltransferase
MKTRIVSAVIMALICIPLVLIGGIPFRIGVGVLGILAYKEILELKGIKNYPKVVIFLGLLVMEMLIYSNRDLVYSTIGLDYKYIVLSYLIMFIPVIPYYGTKKYTTDDAFKLTSFIMFLGIVLNLISNILIYEKMYFFLIILVTVLTDSFAYFTGVAIGKHKVTKISPKKSLEGYIGGVLMGTILTSIYYMTFIGNASLTHVIPVLLVLSIVCEVGDLFYSAIKREHDIKDFSNLIPGHGGILDRIDSLTFVTLAFVLLKGLI